MEFVFIIKTKWVLQDKKKMMEEMIKQQFFALDLEILMSWMQSLELEERVMIYSMNFGIKCVIKLYPEELGNLHVNMQEWNLLLKNWKG